MRARKIAAHAVVAFLGATGAWWLGKHQDDLAPSAVLLDVRDQAVSVQGGTITLSGTIHKNKACRVVLDQGLGRRASDGSFDWFPMPAMASLPALKGEVMPFRIHLPVPAGVPDGPATYYAAAYDEHCAGFGVPPARLLRVPVPITKATTENAPTVPVPPGPVKLLPQGG